MSYDEKGVQFISKYIGVLYRDDIKFLGHLLIPDYLLSPLI